MRGFLHRGDKFQPVSVDDERLNQPQLDGLWQKCPNCGETLYSREVEHNLNVCPKCDHHFRLGARERIALLLDEGSFEEWDTDVRTADPLGFIDPSGSYAVKVEKTRDKTGESESLITGVGTIEGRPIAVAVADFGFMGASMGSVFGEKLTRAVERSTQTGAPLLSVNASGGARMHEGLFSLMQMAKTVAAFARLGEARVPHLSLLVDPCYGGVTASYATVADIIMAEPGALIGFAGPRVIEQITKQKLPDGFQAGEFFLDHGMIDLIVDRASLRRRLADLLDHYAQARQVDRGESIPWMPNLSTNGHGANGNATVGDPQNGAAQ
ncbi:MAG: acetyl-CoA carboxylase carboxyltransferase subunit beta [Thermomicrobiales bacterium]|nr:MAG: acetyl-CoA carboxylase carboxyltransferase subunit beta [Thermomicrobiales bacterium]